MLDLRPIYDLRWTGFTRRKVSQRRVSQNPSCSPSTAEDMRGYEMHL